MIGSHAISSELEQPLEGSIPETVVCVCVSGWGGVWERNSHLSDIRLVSNTVDIGVRARGARGAAAPPNFGQLRFFGQ